MTGNKASRVVRIPPARRSMTRKKAVALTEEERQILLAELAEIAAELDELHARTRQITARVHKAESASPTRETGAA
ncbi:hypothetical protein SAMN04489713_1178 [Actinomadura madurae]|uniref:Uncharacterized protein n=1 Tax=Actinomadura madurae TaxID=1993 RepID=A0A1I5SSQ1_9ACTN|nr:hypothetical protein [Actinomadura madurae]SFP73779.1 hypothetical protein SAMN04489713_1178 [Actinomadura madurae]